MSNMTLGLDAMILLDLFIDFQVSWRPSQSTPYWISAWTHGNVRLERHEALDVPQSRLVNIQSTHFGIRLVKGGAVSKGENPAKPTLEGGSDAWLGHIRLRSRSLTRPISPGESWSYITRQADK